MKKKTLSSLGGFLVERNIVTNQTSQAVDDGRHGHGLRSVDVAPHLEINLLMSKFLNICYKKLTCNNLSYVTPSPPPHPRETYNIKNAGPL